MKLDSIDPGNAKAAGRVCYVARFVRGELEALRTSTREQAQACGRSDERPDVVAIEMPQHDGRKVPLKIMIGLSWNGALVAAALHPEELVEYEPRQWKGSINKHAHHLQIWRRLNQSERLIVAYFVEKSQKRKAKDAFVTTDDVEKMLRAAAEKYVRTGKKTKHVLFDFLDAIGVGLRYLGRIGGGTA
jgi:hypothetical protein